MTPQEISDWLERVKLKSGFSNAKIAEDFERTEQWLYYIRRNGCDKVTGMGLKYYDNQLTKEKVQNANTAESI